MDNEKLMSDLFREMIEFVGRPRGVAILIGIRNLLGRDCERSALLETARSLDTSKAAGVLSVLCRLYEEAPEDPHLQRHAATRLIENETTRSALLTMLDGEIPHLWFNSATCLYGLRILAEATATSGVWPGSDEEEAGQLGEWLLALAQAVTDSTGGVPSGEMGDILAWLAWEVRSWQLYAQRNAYEVFARTSLLFFDHLDELIPDVTCQMDLKLELEKLLPVPPQLYAEVVAALYALFFEHGPLLALETSTEQWGQTTLTWGEITPIIDDVSTDLRSLERAFRETDEIAGTSPANRLPFLKTPLIRIPSGSICVPVS
jgi:hypothetical protein